MRKKLKNGGVAEDLLRQTYNTFMNPSLQGASAPNNLPPQENEDPYGDIVGATMLAQPLMGTTALQNYGKGYLAAEEARRNQANQDESFRLHEEELKQKMINTLMTVNQYKAQNELQREQMAADNAYREQMLGDKRRENELDFAHKDKSLNEASRHHRAEEEIASGKLSSALSSEKNKELDKIISRGGEASHALSTYKQMASNPGDIDQLNHGLKPEMKVDNRSGGIFGLFGKTGSGNIDTAKKMHYPDYLSGKIAAKLKTNGESPDDILHKISAFKKLVSSQNIKNIKDVDNIALKLFPEIGENE